MTMPMLPPIMGTAVFSDDGRYRYALTRRWGDGAAMVWIMLNPSTADADENDPTIKRCIGFAQRWGYDALTVVNVFAFCTSSPAVLLRASEEGVDIVGPANDAAIRELTEGAPLIVAAWGEKGAYLGRDRAVVQLLEGRALMALALTGNGSPGHPLYLLRTSTPQPFTLPAGTSRGWRGKRAR